MKFLWIFDYDALWTLGVVISALWSWGGSGVKFFRKIMVPAVIAISALSVGAAWWLCLLTFWTMFAAISIPYGSGLHEKLKKWGLDDFYYAFVFLVSAIYAMSLFPLCFFRGAWLMLVILTGTAGAAFVVLTFLSQTIDFPKWKLVEMTLGFIIGLEASILLVF